MTETLTSLTGGDLAAARQLRRALEVLAEDRAGSPLARRISETLRGRLDPRELAADPELTALAREGMERYVRERAAMTPEERERADAAAAAAAELAEQETAEHA